MFRPYTCCTVGSGVHTFVEPPAGITVLRSSKQ
eukprot:SAG31_NODE_43359_length_267_cov_0.922619_1_plen_32_part_01